MRCARVKCDCPNPKGCQSPLDTILPTLNKTLDLDCARKGGSDEPHCLIAIENFPLTLEAPCTASECRENSNATSSDASAPCMASMCGGALEPVQAAASATDATFSPSAADTSLSPAGASEYDASEGEDSDAPSSLGASSVEQERSADVDEASQTSTRLPLGGAVRCVLVLGFGYLLGN